MEYQNIILKIGVDSGKGWLKITCSMYIRKGEKLFELILGESEGAEKMVCREGLGLKTQGREKYSI